MTLRKTPTSWQCRPSWPEGHSCNAGPRCWTHRPHTAGSPGPRKGHFKSFLEYLSNFTSSISYLWKASANLFSCSVKSKWKCIISILIISRWHPLMLTQFWAGHCPSWEDLDIQINATALAGWRDLNVEISATAWLKAF